MMALRIALVLIALLLICSVFFLPHGRESRKEEMEEKEDG